MMITSPLPGLITSILLLAIAAATDANRHYLLYDVNPGEGFNLRRDVYMRMASLARALSDHINLTLVLPPWSPNIYHWSRGTGQWSTDAFIPWTSFFHLPSLQAYTPVIEFHQFVDEMPDRQIDQVFYLQNFPDTFKNGVKWVEKVKLRKCLNRRSLTNFIPHDSESGVSIFGFPGFHIGNASCLSAQGSAISVMKPFLLDLFDSSLKPSARCVMLDRAEVLLHDHYGLSDYWKVRRSMRFAPDLVRLGDEFRAKFLNSTDMGDQTVMLDDWSDQQYSHGHALGGPYLAVHLRRADYTFAHGDDIPSIKGAAAQINGLLDELGLTVVFLATDADAGEVRELKALVRAAGRDIHQFGDRKLSPGEVAIIDQWLASHARYFIGTHVSTFSYRIQEEREIMGFDPDTTFNRLCPDRDTSTGCEQPARWMIVYTDQQYWDRLSRRGRQIDEL